MVELEIFSKIKISQNSGEASTSKRGDQIKDTMVYLWVNNWVSIHYLVSK